MAGARPQADAGMTDARLLLGVWPYAGWFDPAPVYQNPNTCQIISAGRDGRFGPGNVHPNGREWTPATGRDIDADGRDDLTNFNGPVLGKQ